MCVGAVFALWGAGRSADPPPGSASSSSIFLGPHLFIAGDESCAGVGLGVL